MVSLPIFKLACLLLLIYSSSLHIVDKLLSEICFANVFSYFIACLFISYLGFFVSPVLFFAFNTRL